MIRNIDVIIIFYNNKEKIYKYTHFYNELILLTKKMPARTQSQRDTIVT